MVSKRASSVDPVFAAVGERVAEERRGRGLMRERVAADSNLAPAYLWRVEAGRQNITMRNLAAIAAAMDVTLSDLLRGVEEKARAIALADGEGGRTFPPSSDPTPS